MVVVSGRGELKLAHKTGQLIKTKTEKKWGNFSRG
jgi:hypothetical protein